MALMIVGFMDLALIVLFAYKSNDADEWRNSLLLMIAVILVQMLFNWDK